MNPVVLSVMHHLLNPLASDFENISLSDKIIAINTRCEFIKTWREMVLAPVVMLEAGSSKLLTTISRSTSLPIDAAASEMKCPRLVT
jgi:hypothetical protein